MKLPELAKIIYCLSFAQYYFHIFTITEILTTNTYVRDHFFIQIDE